MRIGGLASGMDIDQMVSDLMKAERLPLDKLTQKKQYMEWQRDDYRDMNKALLELDKFIFDGVFKEGSYIKKNITVSNPDAISIKNINSTSDFSGSIIVNDLATAATMYSSAAIDITDSTKKLSEIFPTMANPQTLTIKAVDKTGKMETTGYTLSFNPADETTDSLISKINSYSGVSAFFDKETKKISIIAKNTGGIDDTGTPLDEPEIILDSTTGFWANFNLAASNTAAAPNGTQGTNASITYNGLLTTRSTNTFNINGVDITLKQRTSTSATPAVTFSSAPDVDSILDTIVKFVDKYNTTIEKINGKIDEKRYRDFQPLTSEQRESMDEKTVEKWEEKAKSGTLRGDSILSSALNKMRSSLYSTVSGTLSKDQLSEIGITTSSNYLEGGKLIIDEDKLRAAISENPNAVYELFAKDGTTTSEKGLARRLRDDIKATMGDIEKRAGKNSSVNYTFTLGRNLDNLDKQITRFEDRLTQVEDRYWRQFTAMEKAIQRSNEQANYLMQQFSGA